MNTTTTTKLQVDDIQGVILSAYGHLPVSTYVFLAVKDRDKVKGWLKSVLSEITSAAIWPTGPDGKKIKPKTAFNVAFNYDGLAILGLPPESLGSFSVEFIEGIANSVARSGFLGDVDDNAPQKWEFGGPTNPTHLLLMLFAENDSALEARRSHHVSIAEANGLAIVATENSYRPDHGKEPFGFRDGMSQPVIEGTVQQTDPAEPFVKAGEFIFGYRNEYDLLPPMPTPDTLGMNGTYLVYRKLEQNASGFWEFIKKNAKNSDPAEMQYLAAKMVGRWPSGAPLTLRPDYDDPALGLDSDRSNNFLFTPTDAQGHACPVGAHIRRANPRDGLEGDPHDSLTTVNHHRLLRRGRVYGPTFAEDVMTNYTKDAAKNPRGLQFVSLNADIKRQFEFVQQTWGNDSKFNGLYNDKDVIMGSNDGTGVMTIQRCPIRRQVQNIPRFVTVKAGGYFFLPGMKALAYIASL